MSLEGGALPQEPNRETQYDILNERIEDLNVRITNLRNENISNQSSQPPISGLRISGFFDLNGTNRPSSSDNTQFDLGQVELDLDHDVSKTTYVRITPVWNNGTGVLSLGPAYFRTQLMDYENSAITEFSISAGKMDIPFGIGLYENGSVNRKIPTRPKAISLTHGGWGDYGLLFNFKLPVVNFLFYTVNGFASSAEVDSAMSLSLGVAEGTIVNTTPSYAGGTRIGITPFSTFEYGMSLAIGQNKSGKNEMLLIGADLQYAISDLSFKGEYISHSLNRSIDKKTNNAYYFESRFSSGLWSTAGRYESFKPSDENWEGRFAFAVGLQVTQNVEVKLESLFDENSDENKSTVQFMTRF